MSKSNHVFAAMISTAFALAGADIANATPSYPANAAGDWAGTFRSGGSARHVFVHIHKTLSGDYVGTMDSPEAGDRNVGIKPIAVADDGLAFAAGEETFRGEWDAARGEWTGTWTDEGKSWSVSLRQDVNNATTSRLRRKPE